MQLIADIETDDLLEKCSVVHCLVLRDATTGELVGSYTNASADYAPIEMGLHLLLKADKVYGHNIIRFDSPALTKLYPWFRLEPKRIMDTLLTVQMRWAHIQELDRALVRSGKLPSHLTGKHSLEAWGYRLGDQKGAFGSKGPGKKLTEEEQRAKWATWTREMQDYCEQDTLVTYRLIQHIRKHGVSAEAVETEHELALYLQAQNENGWPFDMQGAIKLQASLSARREHLYEELQKQFGCWSKPKERDKNGAPVVRVTKTRRHVKGPGGLRITLPVGIASTPIEWLHFNPGSRQHIANRLQTLYGWKPTVFTPSGQPEVNEKTLAGLPQDIPGVKLLMEFLLVEKRLGQLSEGKEGWLRHARIHPVTGMYHIHGDVLQNRAVTHRAAHVHPNLAQVPKVGKPFGEECRRLFRVPPGWVQIGADASGLELRELAHYMARYESGAYVKTVCEGKNEDGTDVHSVNRNALGLEGKKGRDAAKTFIYAFLYGSGELNLGQLVGVSDEEVEAFKADPELWAFAKATLEERDYPTDDRTATCFLKGRTLKSKFLKNTPALRKLIEAVKAQAKKDGYLTLHDGRRVYIRHAHAALNSLLQGAGATICKRWIVHFNRRLTAEFGPQGWTGKWAALGWIHDEVQIAVRPEIAERVKVILVEEIRGLSAHYKLRCPLDGEAKVGTDWASTH